MHAIVSAGALSSQGTWIHSRKNYLFPVKVMARLFRRLFREALLEAIDAGHVRVLPEHVEPMRRALFVSPWHVYAKAPFGGAQQVYSYLGRYTHRVGISNARIRHADEHGVTFATKDGRTCTLAPVEFLRRLLLHVLPKGFHKIRHYGLCASHHVARGTLQHVREMLEPIAAATLPAAPEHSDQALGAMTPQTWFECMLALAGLEVLRCPRCTQGHLLRLPLQWTPPPTFVDTS